MKTAAAIKRASQQARNAMQELDRATSAELRADYERAAEAVATAIAQAVGPDDLVRREHLQVLLRQIEDILQRMGLARDAVLTGALEQAATLGVRPYTLQGVGAVGGTTAVLDSAAAMRISEAAVEFVASFRMADGLALSDRLWRLDLGAKEVLQRAVSNAVVQGWSASKAVADLVYGGKPVPPELAATLGRGRKGALLNLADLLTGGEKGADGSELWKAERVMRTEINRAHGEAYTEAAQQVPGFAGFRYLLSPRHPEHDICFRRGTPVATQRGQVPIEDVMVGDLVLTHKGRLRPVLRLYRSASGPSGLVRLRFPVGNSRTHQVVMTPNHPVLTPQGWTAAGDLQTGQAVVCEPSMLALLAQRFDADASHTAQPGSAETASTTEARTADSAPHGAHWLLRLNTTRNALANWLWPIGLPTFGAPIGHWPGYRLSMPGCSLPFFGLTKTAGIALHAETNPDDVCRNSGCVHPALERTLCSNTSVPCCNFLTQKAAGKSGSFGAVLRGWLGSTALSKTPAPAHQPGTFQPEKAHRSQGTESPPWLTWTEPRNPDHKTACLLSEYPAQIAHRSDAKVLRNIHKVFQLSCGNYIAFTQNHPIVDKLSPTFETVFNLEVQEDNSYIAGGVVVHNCDLLSTQNLHGLGPGVYPDRERTPWPAHPNTLSFLETVFEDDVTDADRAGKETELQALQRMAPAVREGVLGVTKAAYFDQGLLRRGMLRSPLRVVEARLKRQGKNA